jgi:hypothetical protein
MAKEHVLIQEIHITEKFIINNSKFIINFLTAIMLEY